MEPVITIDGLCKRYRETQALDDVSLEIPPGVVFAVLGENGAGKSTLIRILTGFVRPDAGTARVLGRDPLRESHAIRREVGYVPEFPALYDWMTPAEIGWFASGFYDDAFLERYLDSVAKGAVPTGTRIGNLSKGQRAKVALALATAHDPDLLILDEPTSGLDPMVRREFLESMVDRAATGKTVLLSSHQINEVERVADIVAILHEGRRRLVRPLTELQQEYMILTARRDDPWVETTPPAEEVLSESTRGRQTRWLVRGLDDRWRETLSPESGVVEASASRASLEEIVVAVCGRDGSAWDGESAGEGYPEDGRDLQLGRTVG